MRAFAIALLVAGIAITTVIVRPRADEKFEPIQGLNVMDAVATPAAVGEVSRLQFRLENFSSGDLTLVGVRSKKAASGAIMVADGNGGSTKALQLLVKQEESLDFETSHIWLVLSDLKQPLLEGGTLPFELVFRTGTVPGRAHVHAALPTKPE